jgi:hypothetical protein
MHWGCGFGVAVHKIPIIQGLGLKPLTFRHSFVVFFYEKCHPRLQRFGCQRCKIVLRDF